MDTVKEAAAFRDAVRRAGCRGPGRRYPAELRRRGAEYLRARQAAGAPLSAILRELGMRRETLAGWAAPAEPEAKPRFVPVTVMEEPSATDPAWPLLAHARSTPRWRARSATHYP